ncbi:MAG: hypothetical protein QMO91_01085 [Candidatus Tisiphia sp.]|nr:hypothetical protein [Candidatus Tisiphia sp.]
MSIASVLASMGWSSVAFGSGYDIDIKDSGDLSDNKAYLISDIWRYKRGGNEDRAVFNEDNLTLIVDKDAPDTIDGIIVKKTGANTIINNNINVGTIKTEKKNTTTATIDIGKGLTLGGHDHKGLGITTLNGDGSTLSLKHKATIHYDVITKKDKEGILNFAGSGTVKGVLSHL